MSAQNNLAHAIMMKFGTSGEEPTDAQLRQICANIIRIHESGKTPTNDDWSRIVQSVCSSAGKYAYFGEDNSNLNALLRLMIQQGGAR